MRVPLILSVLVLSSVLAVGQDAATMAAQQAAQAAQLANQQAMQAAQLANQQAMAATQQVSQDNQRAMQQSQQAAQQAALPQIVPMPRFSVKQGTYPGPLTVKIKPPRETTVYYTTDGWTPTKESTRYTGPIAINRTTTLQAVAIYNGIWKSFTASATYKVSSPIQAAPVEDKNPANAAPMAPNSSLAMRILTQGTPVRLAFASDLSSKTADIGDKIPMILVQDIKVGDVVLVKKGTPAVGLVTGADGKHILGVPGQIIFEANSLTVDGVEVKLRGGAVKEAPYRSGAMLSAMIVPGLFLLHGHEAEIKSGASFVASVSEDTPLPPGN